MREFLRIYGHNEKASTLISQKIQCIFQNNQNNVVFLCVGTDKIIFDSLGCMVGQILKNSNFPFYIYGDLQKCITGKNVAFAIDYIRTMHPFSVVCVVDAMATTSQSHLDEIIITDEYVSSLSSNIKINADIFIYGITTVLNEKVKIGAGCKLYNIYNLAKVICEAISRSYNVAKNLPNIEECA